MDVVNVINGHGTNKPKFSVSLYNEKKQTEERNHLGLKHSQHLLADVSSVPDLRELDRLEKCGRRPKNIRIYWPFVCPNFFLDTGSFHPKNDITNLNKTLRNFGGSSKAKSQRLQIYPGAIGTKAFAKPGRFYFEVDVYFYVHRHLREDQIFEIGMAQGDEIDKKFTACAGRYAWMICVRMCPICNAFCLQTWHNGKLLRHRSLKTHIQSGTKYISKLGFLVNMEEGELQVVDAVNRRQFYRFRKVDVTRPLWPIFGVFNSGRVHVSLTLRTGSEIDETKLYFKD